MRGHENLIAIRQRGMKPKMVFINDYQCQTDWFETKEHVTICTHGDDIETLDIRFFIGLAVSVSTTQEKRAKALLEACKRALVSVCAVCVIETDKHASEQSGFCEIWRNEHG